MKDITPKYNILSAKEKIQVSHEELGGRVGGMSVTSASLSKGSGDEVFKVTSKGLHLGGADFDDAPFRVDMEGNLHGASVTLTGPISATNITVISGTVGGVEVVPGAGLALAAGDYTEIQYNNGDDVLGASSNFTFVESESLGVTYATVNLGLGSLTGNDSVIGSFNITNTGSGGVEVALLGGGDFVIRDSDEDSAIFDITGLTDHRTYTFPDASGTIALASGTILGLLTDNYNSTDEVILDFVDISADRTYTLQDADGTLAFISDIPTSSDYATPQLDNLSSTAINTDLLPDTDDAHTLGDDTHRWMDIFLGPGTLHIGTSVTDEGTVSYDTGTNTLTFSSTGTISFPGGLTGNVTGNASGTAATVTSATQAAITTLANLVSIQGRTVTLADAGANAIFGWDDTAGAYENLTQAEARTVLGLGTAALVATDLADLNEATIEGAIDTLANLTSVQGRTVTLSDAGFDVVAGWDDSASAYKNFLLADITAEGTPASGDFFLMYGAEGDLRKVDFDDMPGGSAGATIELDNLGTTAINAHLLFDTDATYDIGASATGINDIHFGSGGIVNFDGGDVTITHSANTLTVAGGDLFVPDEAYDASGWDNDLSVPTKNAVRDKFESLSAGSGITRGQAYALRFSLC